MKKSLVYAASAVAGIAGLLVACSDKKCGDTICFEDYEFSAKAVGADADSLKNFIDDYSGVWECTGRGVLPVNIGDKDITVLRDTLEKLALVTFADGKPELRLPPELRAFDPRQDSDTLKPKSRLAIELYVDLATPSVVVFKAYVYSYSEGAAHGMYSNTFVNYSVKDGKVLTLSDLFKPGYEKELQAMIADKAESETELLVEKDEVPITPNFRITDNGVEFVYSLYAIAPYAAGEVSVEFNAYELGEMLTPSAKKMITSE